MSTLYVTLCSWHPCYTWEKSKFIAGWTSNFDLAYNENHENHWSSMKCLKSWMIFNSFHLHCPAWPCHEHSQRAQRSETATDGAPPRALSEAWPSAPTLPCSESCGSWRRPDFLLTVPLILKGFSGGALGACLHIITYIIIYIYNIYIYISYVYESEAAKLLGFIGIIDFLCFNSHSWNTDLQSFFIAAGAFGTAMANHLANKGITVQLWAREEEVELLASLCIS